MNNKNLIITIILTISVSLLISISDIKDIFKYYKLNYEYKELLDISKNLKKDIEYLENEYSILDNKDTIRKDLLDKNNDLIDKKDILEKDIESLNKKIKKKEDKIKEIEKYLNK